MAEDAFALNRREYDRKSSGFQARVTVGGASTKCLIEDISPGGAQIVASLDLSKGRHLTLDLGAFGDVSATVAWCRKGRLGLKFEADPEVLAELVMSLAMQA
ncbi:PilZ domain-containing protein [Thalassospiraceae bacterium LMO-SO8]|nr:PilZ domain-containing protein [Alphaproteobacteria bacterium LMO-S08]WND75378.1 PilZ domain-containing protein [Thalassospiraceae bacterium LMO-SO8]